MSAKKVMVVEDEALVARDLAERLERFGYQVTGTAASGEEALRLAKETPPDLALMDFHLQGDMDGAQTATAINAQRDVPIVFLTAYSDEGTLRRIKSTTFYGYVLKPFQDRELEICLEAALARHAAEAESRRLLARLQEANDSLTLANKDLGDFAAAVAHDLKAPLQAVYGFAQLLAGRAGSLDETGRRYVDRICDKSLKMSGLIDGLLKFSSLSGRVIAKSPVDMAALAGEVVDELRAAERDRTISTAVGPLPTAQADPVLIRQVLVNLLSNAFKYTRRSPDAQVEVGGRVEGGENVYFVKDNGAGFDMTQKDRLFGVFQRLHKDEEFEGTGVGLATLGRIVRRHGGRAWAEGKPGAGATFYFTLPKEKA